MKKTLTVNLNNIVFHIDDDAYEMLQTYLAEISEHFKSEDERKEIMNDIEARIAELFTEKLQRNKNVVNLSDVQEIIDIMGKPSQYTGEDEEPETPKSDKKQQQKSRRFYRDPENAVLGGVAGGLAAYFDWDVTWVRIAFVTLALISAGYMIPIYIIVWLIAPKAITASQRLEMQGEDVTVESIKSELNNVKNYMESDKFKQSASTVGERILDILRVFFKIVFGFVGAVLGVVGIVLVAALIFILFFLIFEPTIINGFAPDVYNSWGLLLPEKMIMLIISLILVVGCPIFMIVYWAVRIISGRRYEHSFRTPSLVVLILWLAGLFMFYSVGANTLIHLHNHNGQPFGFTWSDNNAPYVDEVRNCEPFHGIDISGNIELTLNQDSVQQVTVSSPDDFLSKINTKVENGILHIYSNEFLMNKTIKVNISTDSIRSLVAKGACKITSESPLKVSDLKIELLGASEAKLDVNVSGLLNVDVNGASETQLSGSCQTFKITGMGASGIKAENLKAKYADVHVSGASNVELYATENLNAEATGASEINCHGNPKMVKKSDSGGSTIRVE
jgi:phage shock protein PspC (stress-responsive transcriptional regulator)